MEDDFDINIYFEGHELSFKATLVAAGYIHKLIVSINDAEVSFEPDEERNYRAIVSNDAAGKMQTRDKEIIRLIIEKLQSMPN